MEERNKKIEEKHVKAVIQPIDRKENPIGKPVEVYNYATIRAYKGIPRIKFKEDKKGFGAFLPEVISLHTGETIPLYGVYTKLDDEIIIKVNDDRVEVVYTAFPRLAPMKRKSGEKEYQPMWSEEVLKVEKEVLQEGEYVDLYIPFTFREISREGEIPIVDDNVIIRIEARKLEEQEKELYQK